MADKGNPFAFTPIEDDPLRERQGITSETASEAAGAAFDLSFERTPLAGIMTLNEISDANSADIKEGQDKLPASQLNEMYPDLTRPFREDTHPRAAALIANRQRFRQELEMKAGSGPKGGAYDTGRFLYGMLPHVMDPLNVGAGFAIGMATPVIAARAGIVAKGTVGTALRATRLSELTAGQAFARGSVEGLIGNIAVEPIDIAASQETLNDVSFEQSFQNVVFGAVGLPGAIYAGKKVLGLMNRLSVPKSVDFLRRSGVDNLENIQKSATAQLLNDQKIDVEPMIKHTVNETNGNIKEFPYKYQKVGVNEVSARRFFTATKSATTDFNSPNEVLGDYLGQGVYLTDNPGVANGAATRGADNINGTVFAVELSTKKLIDLNEKLDPAVVSKLNKFAEENGIKLDFEKTGKEVLDQLEDELSIRELDPDLIDNVNADLRKAGFDGYLEDGSSVAGIPHSQHNKIMLFDPEKVTMKDAIESRPDDVPTYSEQNVNDAFTKQHDPKNKVTYDEDFDEAIKTREADPYVEEDINKVKEANQFLDEDLKEMEKQGLLDEEDVKFLETVRELEKQTELTDQIIKAAQVCVRV